MTGGVPRAAKATMESNQVQESVESALRERVKELTCLYGIARMAGEPNLPQEEILQRIVALLPPAWQYPEITAARITLDENSYATPGFQDAVYRQAADVVVRGELRGAVEVVYITATPPLDEGPFLREERNLLNAIGAQVASIIERREAENDKSKLQRQLLHADRLATIGLLAAGVAHELNEPLGNILGFAQLARKCPGLPELADQDIGKIEAASLHAREVIKKLLVFARQMPPEKRPVDLNLVVEEELCLFDDRCANEGIEVHRSLATDLPKVVADRGQIGQVLVNLVVNALQAMSEGGTLTVSTTTADDGAILAVQDTGTGMSKEVQEQMFVPFFTTKDVGQGTGLGLPVIHGIVTSHGGSIRVQTKARRGTRFEVWFPCRDTCDLQEVH